LQIDRTGAPEQNFTKYQSDTLLFTFSHIEGYLMKAIENKKIYHLEHFHLRYFRVIFTTGIL